MSKNSQRDQIIRNMNSHGMAIPITMMVRMVTAQRMVDRGELIQVGHDKFGKPTYMLREDLRTGTAAQDRAKAQTSARGLISSLHDGKPDYMK